MIDTLWRLGSFLPLCVIGIGQVHAAVGLLIWANYPANIDGEALHELEQSSVKRLVEKEAKDYRFIPKEQGREDLSRFLGNDSSVVKPRKRISKLNK